MEHTFPDESVLLFLATEMPVGPMETLFFGSPPHDPSLPCFVDLCVWVCHPFITMPASSELSGGIWNLTQMIQGALCQGAL